MARRPIRLALFAGVTVVALASAPVAAHGGAADTTAEQLIRSLGSRLVFLAVTIAVLVEGAFVYAVLKYRNSGDAKSTGHNPRFHIAFVAAVSLVLLYVGFASFQTMGALNEATATDEGPPADAVEVNVVGAQWLWTFEYPERNVTTRNTLVVPVNRTAYLNVTTRDVIHSFHVPSLGLKRDAIPGQYNELVFTPTETGEYQLYCAEYCGRGHSNMLGTVRVVNRTAYERWLDRHGGGDSTTNATTSPR